MTVGNLIGEELSDPASSIQTALNVQVGLLVLVIPDPDEGKRREQANDEELEDEDRIQQFVHQTHQV